MVNARAIHYGLMMGEAFDCEIAPRSIFPARTTSIPTRPRTTRSPSTTSPLCSGGRLGDVRLNRIHLEEDAAKLIHLGESGRIHGSEASIVDYNRGGTPLAEIVTEPDIHSAEEARDWLNLLRVTLRQLGVSDVNMEEGSLRADANVSVRRKGDDKLGTKTELKNMNSFRFLMQGINAEVKRQIALMEGGDRVMQETLHFDPTTRAAEPAALQGGGARLPLLPRARPRAGRPHRGDARGGPRGAARAAGRPRRALRARLGPGGGHRAAVRRRARVGRLLRGGRHLRRRARVEARSPTGSSICAARLDAGVDPMLSMVSAPAIGRLAQLVADRSTTAGNARKVLDVLVAEGGDPDEIVEREGLAAMEDDGELAGDRREGASRTTRTSSSGSRAATRRRWARWSGRS